ncbi:hypothetical protein [Streptomyces californicus]|uniref:hypothetical protein n=1 Tax=Streptomyces californicus TaxID=67351 RepID=UPI0037B4052B
MQSTAPGEQHTERRAGGEQQHDLDGNTGTGGDRSGGHRRAGPEPAPRGRGAAELDADDDQDNGSQAGRDGAGPRGDRRGRRDTRAAGDG